MRTQISDIEESIQRMTATIRQEFADEMARSFGEDPSSENRPLGWWILACGEVSTSKDFDKREAARLQLLEQVQAVGLMLQENIWVWDDSGQVQLVIATVPAIKRADILAKHLRNKGLTIRIVREKI